MLVDRFTDYRTRYGFPALGALEAEAWWRLEHAGRHRGGDGGLFGKLRRYAYGKRKGAERRHAPPEAPATHAPAVVCLFIPVTDSEGARTWLPVTYALRPDEAPWALSSSMTARAAHAAKALTEVRAAVAQYTGHDVGWPGSPS